MPSVAVGLVAAADTLAAFVGEHEVARAERTCTGGKGCQYPSTEMILPENRQEALDPQALFRPDRALVGTIR